MFEVLNMFNQIDKDIYKDNVYEVSDLYIEDNVIVKSFYDEILNLHLNFEIMGIGNGDYTLIPILNDETSNRVMNYILSNLSNKVIAVKSSKYKFTFILIYRHDNFRRLEIAGMLSQNSYIKFIEVV